MRAAVGRCSAIARNRPRRTAAGGAQVMFNALHVHVLSRLKMQFQRVGRGASLFDSSAPPCAGASEQDRTWTFH